MRNRFLSKYKQNLCGLISIIWSDPYDEGKYNCPNVMIAISSIEFCPVCSGPNHDSSCIRKNRVNFLKINILIFSPKFQKYGCDYLVFRNCGVSALFSQ